MNAPAWVQLSITQGPIIIPSLEGAEVAATHPLWDGAIASEYFPPGAGASGANYVVTLKRSVREATEVRHVEDELTRALFMLAEAWPFSGGSHMEIVSRELISSPRFESNADAIEQQLLARNGLEKVTATFGIPAMTGVTYAQPPLALAIRIAELTRVDVPTKRLLHYHYQSRIDRISSTGIDAAAWCINLYKVRDFLCKLYEGESAARTALGIGRREWSDFGKLLNNNDLRHAEISGTAPPFRQADINFLYTTAHTWISSYLKTKGLQVS
jgi:hypothetical protein